MTEEIVSDLRKNTLKICINELRDVLNQLCCKIDEPESKIEMLAVSQKLDKLIIEYINLEINIRRNQK